MSPTLLLAGATGLVGSEVLRLALGDPRVAKVVVLVRKRLDLSHPKLEQWLAAEGALLSGLRDAPVDAVICCLGTTMRNVGGDKQRFIHVDHDLVLGLGVWAKDHNSVFSVVSAVGADARSRFFYNKVKGLTEEGLKALGLRVLHIFQPSILTGPRKERRIGERIGIGAMRVISPLLVGSWAKYKPMPHHVLAKALLNSTLPQTTTSPSTHQYREIVNLADQN
jgi:uncharacterized protein YbjT (DUF2867 family)